MKYIVYLLSTTFVNVQHQITSVYDCKTFTHIFTLYPICIIKHHYIYKEINFPNIKKPFNLIKKSEYVHTSLKLQITSMLVNLHKKCVANTDFYLKNLLNKSLTTALQSCLIYSTISSKSDENHDKPKYSYI